MCHDDIEYYSGRAEQELDLASNASHPRAAWIHLALATAYFEMVDPDQSSRRGQEALCHACNQAEFAETE